MRLRNRILSALLVALIAISGFSVQATDNGEEFRAGEVVVELKPGAIIEALNERIAQPRYNKSTGRISTGSEHRAARRKRNGASGSQKTLTF